MRGWGMIVKKAVAKRGARSKKRGRRSTAPIAKEASPHNSEPRPVLAAGTGTRVKDSSRAQECFFDADDEGTAARFPDGRRYGAAPPSGGRGLYDGLQPGREGLDGLLAWMIGRADEVEAISRKTQIKGSYQRAGRELARHEHIAKDADALRGNHRFDRMQLLPEAQVVHVLEFRHVAPLASRGGEPSLPGWRS